MSINNGSGFVTPLGSGGGGSFSGLIVPLDFNDLSTSINPTTYTLQLYVPYTNGYTIKALYIQSASGTCTASLQINGTPVTGISAVSVSSVLATANATGANTASQGNTITLVISSPSSLNNLQGTVSCSLI